MAIKAFNSIGGFSVGENAANIILANGEITTSNANLSANLYVSDTANVGNLRTDHIYYANGDPYVFTTNAAGANTYVQFNDGNAFGGVAGFTFDKTSNLLTVGGNVNASNANLGNLATANFFHGVFDSTSSNQANITAVGNLISLNVDGIANLANTVNVTGNIEANANINANANITGANLKTLGLANIGNLEISGTTTGNLIPSANVTFNLGNATNRWKDLFLSGSSILLGDQNISSNASGISLSNTTYLTDVVVSGNANISLNIQGNTANFIGNVIAPNVTVNLELSGNTANFSGNVVAANVTANSFVFAPAIVQNASFYDTRIELSSAAGIIQANTGGNVTQFLPGGSLRLPSAGASDIISGTFDGSKLVLGTSQTDLVQNRGGNVTVQTGTGGTTANTWTFAQDGNLYAPGAFVANVVKANVSVLVGNSTITYGNVTTTSVSANQTIASFSVADVTGVEYLVKAIDNNGVANKYSVATVLAVTDGTSVDYTIYGSAQLGGYTGSLAVNISGGYIRLQVTPSSSNSTVWTTQYRLI